MKQVIHWFALDQKVASACKTNYNEFYTNTSMTCEKGMLCGVPFPEPMLLEDEGALLQRYMLGLHKEEAHKYGHHNNTNRKEEESRPLQSHNKAP